MALYYHQPGLNLAALARFAGIAAPVAYAGLTAQCSMSAEDIRDFATPRIMAHQWLQLYQRSVSWVLPTLLVSSFSNLYLFFKRPPPTSLYLRPSLYLISTLTTLSILPLTFLYFEPGINGACKAKVSMVLLREEGPHPHIDLETASVSSGSGLPSAEKQSATEEARRWAERTELAELVGEWGRRNQVRWVIAGAAAGLSGWATFCL